MRYKRVCLNNGCALAMLQCISSFFSSFRQTQAYEFLFLITDGISNTEVEKEPQLIEELHSRNISVYGVGVGLFLKYKLQNITRNASRVILVKQYDELSGIAEVSNLLFYVFCFIFILFHKGDYTKFSFSRNW